jgi:filamentous hemagglutinin family protein
MKAKKLFQRMILALGRVMPGVIFLLLTRHAEANPTGMTVQSGSASASVSGSRLTVTAGNNAVLNWQSFNIAAGETTVFKQPSAQSIVWNHIGGQSASQIYGNLQANGIVVLLNSSGFYFGPSSYVSAAGLVVSTANCTPPDNAGGMWQFNGPPPLASIVNYGQIQVGHGGSCFLIADQIENHGNIEAPGGSVGLASGKTVMLSERPDGRGMSMNVTLPQGSVNNYGTLVADAGIIALNAKVVNQDGFIQANSVKNDNGVIELVGGDQLNLGADSKIFAQGDASAGGSAGGNITLKSDNSFSDISGSEISVAGGANGGNGGTVELSAPVMPAIHSAIDGTAQAGFTGGNLLLDPDYIVLDTYGGDSVGSGGTVPVGSNPGSTLDLNVNSAFTGFSQINLQAKYDITLADGTTWNLSDSTGQPNGQLVLEAGRNIIFGNQTALIGQNNWSISMYAGVSAFGNTPTVAPSAGSIYLNAFDPNNPGEVPFNPNGYVQTAKGDITMVAGQDITVGLGRVTTTDGGNITAHALAGSIDTGGYAQGYRFFATVTSASGAYYVDPSDLVGGISTTAGGDVTLTAGGNVTSVLPIEGGYIYDGVPYSVSQNADVMTAGSGAYGSGAVTVIAGGDVTGNYLVAKGTGNIFAGVQMDANGNPIKNVAGNYVLGATGDAGNDMIAPNLSLSLISGGWNVTAAHNINLMEVSNPNGDFNTSKRGAQHQFDYALSDYVNLTAGDLVQLGGSASLLPRLDSLDNLQVPIIFPSILNINAGAAGVVLTGDSTYNQISLFPSKYGGLTVKTTDGGSLQAGSFTGQDMSNFSLFSGIYNLVVSDSGSAAYTSNILGLFGPNDHSALGPVHANSETPLTLNISGNMNNIFLVAPEAAQITVGGDMSNSRFQGMNLSAKDVTSIDVAGQIKNDPSSDGLGYELGGGGEFDITANSIDLGTTAGILSWGVGLYNLAGDYPLANLFDTGANIKVTVAGDLNMISSAIASFNGGNIYIKSNGGNIVAGSASAPVAQGARGIYTTSQGDVTVIADGDIDLNRSRIATYDGGNVTVESLNGNIDAGSGGGGFVVVNSFSVDPKTHEVTSVSPTIPGSGILATTFPFDKNQTVGNVLVETPNGNINASAGGILQSPYNKAPGNKNAITEVLAGYELRDSGGHPVYADNIGAGAPARVSDNRDINASGSGIIGENIVAQATGTFQGAIFSHGNVSLTAPQIANAVVLGTVVSTSGSLGSGVTLIGTESVSTGGANGGTILSADANGGGSSFSQGVAANATSSAASASASEAAAAATKTDNSAEEDPLKKKKNVTLARKVSRVTVLLPGTK